MLTHQRKAKSGFSLVEVTMAIGIIAFAFVALLGLIPTGLGVFRESIDTANEMWIVQNLNSMIQVTPWNEVEKLKDYTFYFDEEGRMTDRESESGSAGLNADEEQKQKRLYAVKLVFGEGLIPGDTTTGGGGSEGNYSNNSLRVVAVFAPYLKPKAMAEFKQVVEVDDVQNLPKNSSVKTRSFLVSRMDSLRDAKK
jgi:uncharacterized protein (TIGR02598 family)